MFERFTAPARETVVAARSEARQMGHQYVGTEHLLLGLLADVAEQDGKLSRPTGAAARVLAAGGVDANHVRTEIVRLVGVCAGGLGDDEAEALQAIGIDLDAVRARLEESFGEGVLERPNGCPPGSRIAFAARSKKVLELSLREARRIGDSFLGPEHILLGLIREGNGIATQILAAKLPLPELRDRLMTELDQAA